MTQRQIVGSIVGALVLIAVFAFVYRQFTAVSVPAGITEQAKVTAPAPSIQKTEEPKTIDDISKNIQDETNLDLSALDDEATGEISDIQSDSDSVNNLGTSYDENSL